MLVGCVVQILALVTIIFGYQAGFSLPEEGNTQESVSYIQENSIPPLFLMYLIFQIAMLITDRALYLYRAERANFIYHVVITIVIHILAFFVVPPLRNQGFSDNAVLVLWYLEQAAYLFVASAQIKEGLPKDVLSNFLYVGDTSKKLTRTTILMPIYFNIPFLYESRVLLDWACTTTTLSLGEWLKLEDITKQLFEVEVKRLDGIRDGRKPGE